MVFHLQELFMVCNCKLKYRTSLELEIENGKNENRKFYKKLEVLTKTYKPRNRNIKTRDESVLTDEKGILNRWNKHFRGEQSTQPFEFYENESYDYIDEEIE